jgi:hypothetical protein
VFRSIVTIATTLLVAGGAGPARAQSGVDLTTYVAVGDGFTAGYQDGALHEAAQRKAYPVLVAAAAGAEMRLPLIGEPGVPTPNSVTGLGLVFQRTGTCGYGQFELANGQSTGRLDPALKATNVAVPFQRIGDVIGARWHIDGGNPSDPDSFEDFVLGYPYATTGELPPATQLETALALHPTFVTVWIGNMDAFVAAMSGVVDNTTLTPVNQFEQRADVLFDDLATTGARGAVLTIPNVTSTALLVSQKDLRRRTGLTTKQLKNRLGVFKTSYVPITALPTVDAIVAGDVQGPLDDRQVLTKDEMAAIQTAIDGYNRKLAAEARRLGWALVDLNALFASYERHGIEISGVGRFNTGYLGGLYSLDAVHPSETLQVVVAIAVISAINEKYGSSLPLPNLTETARAEPHACAAGKL